MKGLRVMFIEPLGDGGIAHYTHNLMGSLHSAGAHLTLFTSRGYEFDRDKVPYEVNDGMFRIAFALMNRFPWLAGETFLPSLIRRFVKVAEYPIDALNAVLVARRVKAEIIHIQTVNYIELITIWFLRAAGFKIVFTVHNVNPRHGTLRWYHNVIYRHLYALCHGVIIHTESGKDEIRELFSVCPEKVSVIPHGDYKFFLSEDPLTVSEAKNKLSIPETSGTVLFFGAIRPNKGLDLAIEAIYHSITSCPDATLVIAGEACENYDRHRARIRDLGIEKNVVEFLDYIPNEDVHLYFTAADIVILPYREITQSGVLQIAYAFGKPVVGTALKGFQEAVEEGCNGFLVEENDTGTMGLRISELLGDNDLRERMGLRSRWLADEKYSWSAIARDTGDVYASCFGMD